MLNHFESPDWVLMGTSPAAQRLRTQLDRIAPYFRTTILVGEAGCLKEQVARALQRRSPLGDHAFHVQNAATLTAESIDLAAPGTIFVANIGQLNPEQQKVVLVQMKQVFRVGRPEMRFICSSEVAPRGLVAAGRLDSELYGCIGAVEVRVPPLRERLEDLPALLHGREVDPEALELLCGHRWPGNLRELREVFAVCLKAAGAGVIGPEHVPSFATETARSEESLRLDTVLRRHVNTVLEGCAGNKLRAAEMLGISRSTLYRMLDAS